MSRFTLIVASVVASFVSPARADKDSNACREPIPRAAVIEHTARLSSKPHASGTDAAFATERYIREVLRDAGIEFGLYPVGAIERPTLSLRGLTVLEGISDVVPEANIVVTLGNGTETRLFMAHYDTVGPAPGAIDNSLSVALLLELAKHLHAHKPNHRVIIALTAAEEGGLMGARQLARDLESMPDVAVSLDMVGYRGGLALNGLGPLMGTRRLEWLQAVASRAQVNIELPTPHRLMSRLLPQFERSDHREFTMREVPAFHLFSREPYPAYHTKWDTLDQVDLDALDAAWRMSCSVATAPESFPRQDNEAGWISVGGHRLILSINVLRIGTALLSLSCVLLAILALRRSRFSKRGGLSAFMTIVSWVAAAGLLFGLEWIAGRVHGHPRPWVDTLGASAVAALFAFIGVGICVSSLRKRSLDAGWTLVLATFWAVIVMIVLLAVDAVEIAWLHMLSMLALAAAAYVNKNWLWLLMIFPMMLPALILFDGELVYEFTFHQMMPFDYSVYFALVILPYWAGPMIAIGRWVDFLRAKGPRLHLLIAATMLIVAVVLSLAFSPRCEGNAWRVDGPACVFRTGG